MLACKAPARHASPEVPQVGLLSIHGYRHDLGFRVRTMKPILLLVYGNGDLRQIKTNAPGRSNTKLHCKKTQSVHWAADCVYALSN